MNKVVRKNLRVKLGDIVSIHSAGEVGWLLLHSRPPWPRAPRRAAVVWLSPLLSPLTCGSLRCPTARQCTCCPSTTPSRASPATSSRPTSSPTSWRPTGPCARVRVRARKYACLCVHAPTRVFLCSVPLPLVSLPSRAPRSSMRVRASLCRRHLHRARVLPARRIQGERALLSRDELREETASCVADAVG